MAAGEAEFFHLGRTWFACWSAAFGPVRWENGLALVERQRRIGPIAVRTLNSATNPHSASYDVAPGTAVPADLPACLLAAPRIACVQFDYLPEDAALLSAARRWAARYCVRIVPHALSPVVDCRGEYESWLANRSKRIRQRLRRDGKQAFDALAMRIEFREDDPVPSGLFDQMLAVERSGWKGRAGTAISDNPAERRFYTALAQEAAAAGALHTALLWHGDRLAAFELGVRGARRLFLLKVGYDEDYADISVGYLLAAEHIRHCFGHPAIDWYDKMGNGMSPAEYKLRFADRCDTLYRVILYAPTARGRLVSGYDAVRARAKAWRDARRSAAA